MTGNTDQCIDDFTVLSAPTGFSNYVWSNGETTRQIVVQAPGNFTVQAGNVSTCLSAPSDAVVITFTGLPCGANNAPSSPAVGNVNRCGSGTVTFNATGATTGQVYRWYDAPAAGTLLFTGADFISPVLTSTTSYYVLIFDPATTLSSNRVAATATIVTVPTAVITGLSTISLCSGSSTLLSAPLGYIDYQWSNGATTQQIQISTAGSYSVKVGDGVCQSASSNSITVLISPPITKPVVTISGNTTLCGSSTVTLSALAGFSYNWSNGATTPSILVSATGNYSVTLSNGICTSPASDFVSVTAVAVVPQPVITVTGNPVLCVGSFAVLTAPLSTTYLWSNGETTRQIVVTLGGNYTVQIGNAISCLSIASLPVIITTSGQPCGGGNVAPLPPFTITESRCGPGNLQLTGSGAGSNQEYRWYQTSSGGIPLIIGAVLNVSVGSTTFYYYSIRDLTTNLESTRSLATAAVILVGKPQINPAGSFIICSGTSQALTATTGYSQYRWSNGKNTQTIQANEAGNYTVQVFENNCPSLLSDPVTIVIASQLPKPQITILGSPTFCTGGSVTLSGPTGYSYRWSTGETTQSITLDQSAVITLTLVNGVNCTSVPSDPLVVTRQIPPCRPNTPPVIDPIVISVNIEGSATIDLLKYVRDSEENIDYSRLQTLTPITGKGASVKIDAAYNLIVDYKGILYSGGDRVTLEVFDIYNQKAQRVIEIDVVGEVIVFNGITPDGDNINDFFYIQYLDVIEGGLKNKVTIVNRWGDTVFEISDYNNIDRIFNGFGSNGNQLPAGTYFYRIDISNRKPITGFITLKL